MACIEASLTPIPRRAVEGGELRYRGVARIASLGECIKRYGPLGTVLRVRVHVSFLGEARTHVMTLAALVDREDEFTGSFRIPEGVRGEALVKYSACVEPATPIPPVRPCIPEDSGAARVEIVESEGSGVIAVYSEPPGSLVYVDYSFRGYTPSDGPLEVRVDAGSHRVAVFKPGYSVHKEDVYVRPGGVAEVRARLEQLSGPGGAPPIRLPSVAAFLAGGAAIGAIAALRGRRRGGGG